jgi:hypothetical protein
MKSNCPAEKVALGQGERVGHPYQARVRQQHHSTALEKEGNIILRWVLCAKDHIKSKSGMYKNPDLH